jgi:site-specific DNA recombinase
MASQRAVTTGATLTPAAHHPASRAPTRDTTAAAGGRGLKRAARDARVSTDTQERQETVARPVDLRQQTAAAHAAEVLPGHVCIADGSSGTRRDRPALERRRERGAEGALEVMLVTAPDRLARRAADQVVRVEACIRGGGAVVLVPPSLGTSPAAQLRLQRPGGLAADARALLPERTRRGRVFAARQGRVTWGHPPDGDTSIRQTPTPPPPLVSHETAAESVRPLSRGGVAEPWSASAMPQRLTAQGMPPRQSTRGPWAPSRVLERRRDALSKGEADAHRPQPGDVRRPYGPRGLQERHPGHGQGRTRRPQTAGLPVHVPARIAPEPWERTQAPLVRKRERAQRHNPHQRSLWRSLLVCGRCGRRRVGTWRAQGGRALWALRDPR